MFDIRMCRVENRLDITIGSTEAYCSILLMFQWEFLILVLNLLVYIFHEMSIEMNILQLCA